MPRRKKGERAFKGAQAKKPLKDREAVITALLADPWGVLRDANKHPLLEGFTARQRTAILRKVERRQWAEREASRLPELLARLNKFPPCQWGDIFAERPDLERKLTRDQRAVWWEWLRSRGIIPRTGPRKPEPDSKPDGDVPQKILKFKPKEQRNAERT